MPQGVSWARFQSPPHQTHRADFQQWAYLEWSVLYDPKDGHFSDLSANLSRFRGKASFSTPTGNFAHNPSVSASIAIFCQQ
jgi:hypothetical protein